MKAVEPAKIRWNGGSALCRLLAYGALALLVSCQTQDPRDTLGLRPPLYTPANVYRAAPELPQDLQRVVVLPLATDEAETALDGELDAVILSMLQKQARFEVVSIDRDRLEELTGQRQWSSVELLPPDLWATLQAETRAEGVLFLDLTHFHPYPPLAMGLRAKLVALGTGDILWAVDDMVYATEPGLRRAVEEMDKLRRDPDDPLRKSDTDLRSPRAFVEVVSARFFETLPLRQPQ